MWWETGVCKRWPGACESRVAMFVFWKVESKADSGTDATGRDRNPARQTSTEWNNERHTKRMQSLNSSQMETRMQVIYRAPNTWTPKKKKRNVANDLNDELENNIIK